MMYENKNIDFAREHFLLRTSFLPRPGTDSLYISRCADESLTGHLDMKEKVLIVFKAKDRRIYLVNFEVSDSDWMVYMNNIEIIIVRIEVRQLVI